MQPQHVRVQLQSRALLAVAVAVVTIGWVGAFGPAHPGRHCTNYTGEQATCPQSAPGSAPGSCAWSQCPGQLCFTDSQCASKRCGDATVHVASNNSTRTCLAPRPLIISTDPGIDDTIALLLAVASPELDLRAVCVDFGSLSNLTQLGHNALAVLANAGASDVPVYLGASVPIAAPFHDLGGELFHGADGLGGATPPGPGPVHQINRTLTAAEAIVEACRTWPTPPALVSLAPLTNIALALDLEPRLPTLCPDLWIMGGTVAAPGNVSPLAEVHPLWPMMFRRMNSHFLFCGVVSVPRCVPPYKHCNRLEIFLFGKPMKLCEPMGVRARRLTSPTTPRQRHECSALGSSYGN